jgi:hypothetical protein
MTPATNIATDTAGVVDTGGKFARFLSDPAERPPQDTNPATQGIGFSPYCMRLYTFSHLFVLNVLYVGHPAEA